VRRIKHIHGLPAADRNWKCNMHGIRNSTKGRDCGRAGAPAVVHLEFLSPHHSILPPSAYKTARRSRAGHDACPRTGRKMHAAGSKMVASACVDPFSPPSFHHANRVPQGSGILRGMYNNVYIGIRGEFQPEQNKLIIPCIRYIICYYNSKSDKSNGTDRLTVVKVSTTF